MLDRDGLRVTDRVGVGPSGVGVPDMLRDDAGNADQVMSTCGAVTSHTIDPRRVENPGGVVVYQDVRWESSIGVASA